MPRSQTSKSRKQGELLKPLIESDRILELLRVQQRTFKYELEDEEIKRWLRDLNRYPMAAIEWAFENWRLNGRFFPVPADIILQCDQWQPSEGTKFVDGCSPECQQKHGKGYHENDIKAFLVMCCKEMQRQEEANRKHGMGMLQAKAGTHLGDEFYAKAFAEIDGKRQAGPPAWKRSA